MKSSADVYGEQLWSFYTTGEPEYEIVERDDGLIIVGSDYGAKMYFSAWKEWDAYERKAIAFARGRVLDIGCSAGRHSLYLQRKGLKVMAIDSSPLSIKIARLRGVKNAKVLPIEKIGGFAAGSFETVLMLGNNFGLFGTFSRARRLLQQLHRITTDDALIIAAATDPRVATDPIDRRYIARNRRKGRMAGQVRLRLRFGTLIGNWFDYLGVSKRELATILKGAGWQARRFIAGRDGKYAMLLAKRPAA